MTTTNNHLTLIDQVGGIEKAKEIVETHPFCYMPHTFKYWSKELDDYVLSTKYATVLVDDLRTAIAQHESNNHQETSHCNNSGNCEKRFNSSEVIKQLESDQITDIRNHISPRTVVWDLASGEDWSVNHG